MKDYGFITSAASQWFLHAARLSCVLVVVFVIAACGGRSSKKKSAPQGSDGEETASSFQQEEPEEDIAKRPEEDLPEDLPEELPEELDEEIIDEISKIELEDGIEINKLQFDSFDKISFGLAGELISNVQSFELKNLDTETELIALDAYDAIENAILDQDSNTINFIKLAPYIESKFLQFGKNRLQIKVVTLEQERTAQVEILIRDFEMLHGGSSIHKIRGLDGTKAQFWNYNLDATVRSSGGKILTVSPEQSIFR